MPVKMSVMYLKAMIRNVKLEQWVPMVHYSQYLTLKLHFPQYY